MMETYLILEMFGDHTCVLRIRESLSRSKNSSLSDGTQLKFVQKRTLMSDIFMYALEEFTIRTDCWRTLLAQQSGILSI